MNKKTFTTYDVAEYCQVTPRSVIQWINENKLKAYRTPGNHSRIERQDFLNFLNKYHMPIPADLTAPLRKDRKRILIVDDEAGMVASIERLLRREKIYDLEIAYDGFEAGERFSDFKPDLIILDIRMPGVDGYKLCSRIRSNPANKDVKILFMSGLISAEEVGKIKEFGADDYVAKPFSNTILKEKVEQLLNGQPHDHPS